MVTRVKTEVSAAPPSNGQTALVERATPPRRHVGPVSFPELVWAHFLWQQEVHDEHVLHGEAEHDYHRLLREFEKTHGEIPNAYWCTREASAVAVTQQRPYGRPGRLLHLHPIVRFPLGDALGHARPARGGGPALPLRRDGGGASPSCCATAASTSRWTGRSRSPAAFPGSPTVPRRGRPPSTTTSSARARRARPGGGVLPARRRGDRPARLFLGDDDRRPAFLG